MAALQNQKSQFQLSTLEHEFFNIELKLLIYQRVKKTLVTCVGFFFFNKPKEIDKYSM